MTILSLSTEFPNPSEPGKGLFVRARLEALAARVSLFVVAPMAWMDYANPQGDLFASRRVPRRRDERGLYVLHPRWLYPPFGGWANAFFLAVRLLPTLACLRARRAFDVIDAHFAHHLVPKPLRLLLREGQEVFTAIETKPPQKAPYVSAFDPFA